MTVTRATRFARAARRSGGSEATSDAQPSWPKSSIGRAGLAALAAAILAAVVINQSAVHWRENLADSHLFAYHGWCVSQGAVPYREVWDNKPPGIWWLNAAAFLACGEVVAGEMLIAAAALAAALAALAGIIATTHQPSMLWVGLPAALVMLTQVHFECGANRTETFVVASECLGALALCRWQKRGGRAWLLLAGAACGAAPWFKQTGLGALVACATVLAARRPVASARGGSTRRRAVGLFLAGAAAAQAPPLAMLAAQGALADAAYAIVGFNRDALAATGATIVPFQSVWLNRALLARLDLMLAWAGLSAVVAVAGLRRAHPHAIETRAHGLLGLAFVWLGVELLAISVSGGHQAYHYQPILPPLTLLSVDWLGRLAGARGLGRALAERPSLAAATSAFALSLGALVPANVAALRACWAQKPHWYSDSRTTPAAYEAQAAEIRRITRPTDHIYVWGWSPGTYRYAYRRCASRFATLEKLSHAGPAAQFIYDGAVADLRRRPPVVFVISEGDFAGVTRAPQSALADWLRAHYAQHATIQGMLILVRRDQVFGGT